MAITFFNEGIDFHLSKPRMTISWIKLAAKNEKQLIKSLNIIFCSDPYLFKLNKRFLGHQTLTDILTFDYSKIPKSIEAEIYISIDRVTENSKKYHKTLDEEVHRVIIHGILHLAGYNDKKASEKALMREKEEAYLSLR